MLRRLIAAVLLVPIAVVLLIAAWPQAFGLQDAPVIAQVVALRGLDVAIALGLLVIFAVIALRWKLLRRFCAAVAALLLLFVIASAAILIGRGYGETSATTAADRVTILSWNTKGDAPGAAEIARVALANHADIVTLPETTQITGTAVASLMAIAGHPMEVHSDAFDLVSKSRSTTMLVSTRLGHYTVTLHGPGDQNTRVLPTVVAHPVNGSGPTIIAVHAVSPIPKEMRNWRADLTWLATQCAGANTIMAGDFNSTLDQLHPFSGHAGDDFGSCTDSGLAAGGASVGTWPTVLPTVLGAQIDHVMHTAAWRTVAMRVITTEDKAGSDHRPVVVTLQKSP